jgi:hypothetical protein
MSALNSLQHGCSGRTGVDSTDGQELRIAGLFAILATSAIGVSLPLLSRGRYPSLLFIARCFGAGIVLATGFAHVRPVLLPPLYGPVWHTAKNPCCAGYAVVAESADPACFHWHRCFSTRYRTCRTRVWAGTGATHSPWSLPHTAPWAPLRLVRTAAPQMEHSWCFISPALHGKQSCIQTVVPRSTPFLGSALNVGTSVCLQKC